MESYCMYGVRTEKEARDAYKSQTSRAGDQRACFGMRINLRGTSAELEFIRRAAESSQKSLLNLF